MPLRGTYHTFCLILALAEEILVHNLYFQDFGTNFGQAETNTKQLPNKPEGCNARGKEDLLVHGSGMEQNRMVPVPIDEPAPRTGDMSITPYDLPD